MPIALDLALHAVIRELDEPAVELPLAVRRFVSYANANSPPQAIQMAAADLLAAYGRTADCSKRISVQSLCDLLQVHLEGIPSRSHMRSAAADPAASSRGYSGFLRFGGVQPRIKIPTWVDYLRARVAVGHELGHLLIHRRSQSYDIAGIRLGTSEIEEALSEYGARLLLMPRALISSAIPAHVENVALACVRLANVAEVTVHSAVARLGDPDLENALQIEGAILWRIRRQRIDDIGDLSPYWHLCPGRFIPLKRGKARKDSIVAMLFEQSDHPVAASACEDVSIGHLRGRFRVDAFAWGIKTAQTRIVLGVFRALDPKCC